MLNLFSATEVTSLGILIGGLAFANFFLFMIREGITLTVDSVNTAPYFIATSLSYSTIVFAQYVNILERRFERRTLFSKNFFSNKIVLVSILISMGLVAGALYGPYVSDFFAFGPMSLSDWYFVLISTGVYLVVFEGLKIVKRLRHG
jgi:Ca2+-transporting ATPase